MSTPTEQPVVTRHTVELTLTHRAGGFPSDQFAQLWLTNALNADRSHVEVDVAMAPAAHAQHVSLASHLLAGVASMGDVFTDAPETAARVAGAKNLMALATLLSKASTIFATGTLWADSEEAGGADVCIDGTLVVYIKEGLDTSSRAWSWTLPTGERFEVNFYAGECADDEAWVLRDAEALYVHLLGL